MSTIFVIRHAEKPDGQIQGVNSSGTPDPESLIPQGWQRAGALAVFFGSKEGLPAPDQIYASSPAGKSQRPAETITPLAAKLKQNPNETYDKGDERKLVDEVVQLKGITLICWQHEAIPEIAKRITGSSKGIPDPWPSCRFDVVWCFTRSDAGKPWDFSQVCQKLLHGDSSKPIT